ncbi:MAG: hypothetical protein KDJ55_10930 [Rhodobiaceae bacterium]|nr:hypothetical protein [Rhodobiaceae bacterium]MCC0017912.1 hypothetical protein [Rhodobiaceae bacterium]MCC0051561.1 hypothetical protein [Rhodobiaceae bacterium]MCC0062136.1 hypothetical protein [Rhodobiaceae bacterium]
MNRFHAILARRAVELGPDNAGARQELYAATRAHLDQLIAQSNPPMSAYQRLMQMQELETAISDIEANIDRLFAMRSRQAPKAPPYQPPQRPPEGTLTQLPPRQGRNVDELLHEYEESRLSFGIIMAIIGGLAVLMVIGVIIALDPSTLDILKRNPGQ